MALVPGQRYISNAEPELGLGTLIRIEGRSVQLLYATAGVLRQYAVHSAPIARAEFRIGQKVSGKGFSLVIESVAEEDGLLVYHGGGKALNEAELDDSQSISRADERLVSGRVDRADHFDFRQEALLRRADALRSPAWGLESARIDLIAHQLRVAEIAAARQPLRILLADEVGLGKTIEAGMILARLLASGRVGRVLVLLPETLVYQWFVELLRRFNLQFSLFDEERCESIETSDPTRNPFQDEQLVMASIGFLSGSAKRAAQVTEAGWDLVIVDEAHHLTWTEDSASAQYTLVENLAARTPGLILLTATPEQLGRSGHFARLRLLDPARYHDLRSYVAEADSFTGLSEIAGRLNDGEPLSSDDVKALAGRFGDDEQLTSLLAKPLDAAATNTVLDALIDRHGTGRVMFRNRRGQVGGFPRRVAQLVTLDGSELDDAQRQHLLAEFHADLQATAPEIELPYANDPRLNWLLGMIDQLAAEKFLLVCRSQAKVIALEEILRTRSGVKVARFHEGMSLLQRDRNAAYFAEAEGARLLLCSEIGSEGRNFQFARHLVLWDLPLDPDLLEQRIGRLDRIGQKHDILIHACAFSGTAQHALMRWFELGLDAFRSSPSDGRELLKRYGQRLVEVAEQHAHGGEDADSELDALIGATRASHEELSALVNSGRDRLLELASARQSHADRLQRALAAADANHGNDEFILRLFEQFGIENEELAPRTVVLDPEYLSTDGFPGLKDGPQQVTFDRGIALAREDLPLLRMDHPMVSGAIDLLLEGEHGNASFLVDDSLPARSAMLECIFVLTCVADRELAVDRYLPPLPIRIVVDSRLLPRHDYQPAADAVKRSADRAIEYSRYRKLLAKLVKPMLAHAETLARERAQVEIGAALTTIERELGDEHARLVALARVNPAVRTEEIEAIDAELEALRTAIPQAAPRLDAVRFICSTDFLNLA
ncbi:MAG: RNA polymerase-associated protein RapA [Dokdonella sp.]|uniref:RNA polymerase-associated protein RapA n=2 Tax=Dokdonella sp. TaxID=2291710 RepID=UPI002B67DCBD|nr:RNA polymerase-associated protein RapA [Xanthomonadales bacterium]HQV71658.1 RNA polymerase-associated protein RapA [Dokdonella sp.]HQW75705.1 RNA polymerase-associated protein RapA [Dokdonella sp.]HQY53942.1 RNA polymerase-associated protein RapA [Dokdonella sp.]